jgi:serine protease
VSRVLLALLPLAVACDPTTPSGTTDTTVTTDTTGDTTEPSPTDTTAPVDGPPSVEIVYPGDGDVEFYDGFDEALGLWYAEFTLEGTGTDTEDGALGGASLVWTTDRTDLQDASLGIGAGPTVRLYGDDCFGVVHELTLTGTDSFGNVATDVFELLIYTLC